MKMFSGIINMRNNPKERKAAWGLVTTPRDFCSFGQGGGHTFLPGGYQHSSFPVLSGFAEISIICFITDLFSKILLKGMHKKIG